MKSVSAGGEDKISPLGKRDIAFFRHVVDNVSSGGILVDRDRVVRYCNSNVESIFGYPASEIIGKRTELLYGDRRRDPSDKKEIYRALEEKGFHEGVASGVTRDGRDVQLELSTFLVKPTPGAVILIQQIARRSGVDRGRFLQNLLDAMPDMIFFKDRKNRFVLVNKAHAAALGLTPEQVIGKTDLDFFPKEMARKYFEDDQEILRTGKGVVGKIERAPREDGGITYVSTTKIPHYDKEGHIVGTIGITRNITDQMIAEEELRKYKDNLENIVRDRTQELQDSNERLMHMYKMKSDFISVVSHELRTPLTIVKEGISLVEDGTMGPLNEGQERGLGTVMRNIDRLGRLIDDVLDLSKLEESKMSFRVKPDNINEVVRQVAKSYGASLEKRGIGLKIDLDSSIPLIKIDRDRITQVMHNLLSNASKFTEKGQIMVKSCMKDGEVRVSVADTGRGIKREDFSRVFDRFEQIRDDVNSKHKGTGLGLAICKQIVEKLGGRIAVEAEPDVGSTFTFSLPTRN